LWPFLLGQREVQMGKDSNLKEEVIIITTGGTIEKSYSEEDGSLRNRESLIKEYVIAKLRLPYTKLSYFSLLEKDSLDMTDDDRDLLIRFIKSKLALGVPIIVVHGTDTMEISAKWCYDQLLKDDLRVPIVFTGAMRPLGFVDTDANQNVIESLMACKLLPPGIYISFHNQVHKVPNVRKNKQKGTFESF